MYSVHTSENAEHVDGADAVPLVHLQPHRNTQSTSTQGIKRQHNTRHCACERLSSVQSPLTSLRLKPSELALPLKPLKLGLGLGLGAIDDTASRQCQCQCQCSCRSNRTATGRAKMEGKGKQCKRKGCARVRVGRRGTAETRSSITGANTCAFGCKYGHSITAYATAYGHSTHRITNTLML